MRHTRYAPSCEKSALFKRFFLSPLCTPLYLSGPVGTNIMRNKLNNLKLKLKKKEEEIAIRLGNYKVNNVHGLKTDLKLN